MQCCHFAASVFPLWLNLTGLKSRPAAYLNWLGLLLPFSDCFLSSSALPNRPQTGIWQGCSFATCFSPLLLYLNGLKPVLFSLLT
jgi:hypothetical protein